MSSLQKFHRRTNGISSIISPFITIGSGTDTIGYWLGYIGSNKLIVAPKTTEVSLTWGSSGTTRGTINTTDGLANTNTLVSFGTSAHPAAGYCKYLSTGGYNTWYLPAKNDLLTMYSNKSKTPFYTSNNFNTNATPYWSSTEFNGSYAWQIQLDNSGNGTLLDSSSGRSKAPYQNNTRAIRMSTI